MASAKAKIRHVFGDTFSCRAAPPDILVELSGQNRDNGSAIEFYYIYIVDIIELNGLSSDHMITSQF